MKWRKSLCDTIYTTIQAVYVFATTVVLIRATFVAPDYLYYKEYNEYRKETILRWSNVEKGAMPYIMLLFQLPMVFNSAITATAFSLAAFYSPRCK